MFELLGLLDRSLRFGLVPEVAAVAVRWLDYVIRGFKVRAAALPLRLTTDSRLSPHHPSKQEPCLLLSPSGLDKTGSVHLLLRTLIEECSADVLRPRLPLLMESIIELLESTAQVPLTNNYHLVSLFGTIGTPRTRTHKHTHDTRTRHTTHDTTHGMRATHVTDAHLSPDVLANSPLDGEHLQPWVGRLSRLLVDHVQRGQATPNANKDGVQALWCCVQLAAASTDCAGEVDRRVVRLLAHADWVVRRWLRLCAKASPVKLSLLLPTRNT
jgi:hypothetical protein